MKNIFYALSAILALHFTACAKSENRTIQQAPRSINPVESTPTPYSKLISQADCTVRLTSAEFPPKFPIKAKDVVESHKISLQFDSNLKFSFDLKTTTCFTEYSPPVCRHSHSVVVAPYSIDEFGIMLATTDRKPFGFLTLTEQDAAKAKLLILNSDARQMLSFDSLALTISGCNQAVESK